MRDVSGASAVALLVLVLLMGSAQGADAWGNGGYSSDQANPDYGTHDRIADLALTLTLQNVSFLKSTYHTQYLLGTEAPDNPEFIGDSTNHHVYYFSSGQVQDDKSAVRARSVYGEALSKLNSSDLSGAAFLIGEMSHYVADVGVFGHTMGGSTDWGAEVHHSDYESRIDDLIGSHTVPSSYVSSPNDVYNATLLLARSITFGDGAIKTNLWMDANYNWSDTVSFAPSAWRSVDLSIVAVASAIDKLIIEAAYIPPNTTEPTDDTPTAKDHTVRDVVVIGLTIAVAIVVSGGLLLRTRGKR
jgi:hypothetical protein